MTTLQIRHLPLLFHLSKSHHSHEYCICHVDRILPLRSVDLTLTYRQLFSIATIYLPSLRIKSVKPHTMAEGACSKDAGFSSNKLSRARLWLRMWLPESLLLLLSKTTDSLPLANSTTTLSLSKSIISNPNKFSDHDSASPRTGFTMCDTVIWGDSTYNGGGAANSYFSFKTREEIQAYIASSTPSSMRNLTRLSQEVLSEARRFMNSSIFPNSSPFLKIWHVVCTMALLALHVLMHFAPWGQSYEQLGSISAFLMALNHVLAGCQIVTLFCCITETMISPFLNATSRDTDKDSLAALHLRLWRILSPISYFLLASPIFKRIAELRGSFKLHFMPWVVISAVLMLKIVFIDGILIWVHYLCWRAAGDGARDRRYHEPFFKSKDAAGRTPTLIAGPRPTTFTLNDMPNTALFSPPSHKRSKIPSFCSTDGSDHMYRQGDAGSDISDSETQVSENYDDTDSVLNLNERAYITLDSDSGSDSDEDM